MAPLQSRSLVTVSVGGDFYQFVDGELAPLDLSLDDSLSVADSFLVSNGSVRALERHFARFARSIHDAKTKRQLPGFFASAAAAIPQDGDWFPRLEYRESQPDGQKLFLRMRTPRANRISSTMDFGRCRSKNSASCERARFGKVPTANKSS